MFRAAPLLADELLIKDSPHLKGTFEGFKNDRISFAPSTGPKSQTPLLRVESLTVSPPAKVTVKPRSGKKMEDVKVVSYTNRTFTIEQNGRTVQMPSASISMIETEIDLSRAMALQAEGQVQTAPNENASVESLVQTGRVTVVHFHMQSVIASVRQGNYVQGLANQSHGKIKLAVVTLDDFNAPMAIRNQIQAVPQFWFYNKSGRLAGKLVGRFEESEIDRMLRDAKK